MNFISTRKNSPASSLSDAIAAGLAPDGGLYVPEKLPVARNLEAGADLAATTATLLAPFFEGDALAPEPDQRKGALGAPCAETRRQRAIVLGDAGRGYQGVSGRSEQIRFFARHPGKSRDPVTSSD